MADVQKILKRYWGYDEFRPLQKEIVESVLAGKDTLAVLPTGAGKSICFQVPSLAQRGICIVVSPLIALMKDQVDSLKNRDIPALLIHSAMKRADVMQTLRNATHDYFKFLYVSPERLETSLFNEYLPALDVNLIAVDEAHCISQWGYDFRPSYLKIAELRKELQNVPVLALTASATEEVQQDISQKLAFRSSNTFRQSFERKNLSYRVFKTDSRSAKLVDILSKVAGTAIVYCKSRQGTKEIKDLLQMHGISSTNYHAGLKQEERNQRQKDWIENRMRVMVCTNAFGMGIDKADVRLVVHLGVPDCLEDYYQQAGRAGRDGKKSYAVLLYNERDIIGLNGLHTIRFPLEEQIKNVYGALVNFLQIPSYAGEYKSYNFHFSEFIRNFKLNSNEAWYALKALESDGWIEINERNFSPSTVAFTTSKRELHEFQKAYPQQEPLLTTLLRTYEGIFDFPVFISEMKIARLLNKDETDIKRQLQTVASLGIISYSPRNEEPQIVFKKHRVPVQHLVLNTTLYNKRKESFIKRVEAMIAYIHQGSCRSRFISNYFGDHQAKDCGICDNCLQKKSSGLSQEEVEKIASIISGQLSQKQLTAGALLQAIDINKEKAFRVIELMQKEDRIAVDEKGILKLK